MITRRANAQVIIDGKDVSKDIEPFLSSISYSDVLEGESDTASINLHDEQRLFIADWFPKRGDTASITLTRKNWDGESGVENLPLGDFEIDEISIQSGESGNKASVKLNSIANKSELRSVDKSKAWEKVKLSKIAKDISEAAGMELFYDTDEDPMIERAEQKEKSNLAFLHKLCKDNGLALKVSDKKIIVFDIQKLEKQDPVKTLKYGDGNIKSFSGRATISKIYKSCHVKYQHGKKGEKFDYTYSDGSKDDGMTIELNKKVESQADAEKLAKKELRKKNKEEIKVSLKVLGGFEYLAGNCITLEGYGFFDGKYIIEKSNFDIGSGFSCSLDVRKCLNDY